MRPLKPKAALGARSRAANGGLRRRLCLGRYQPRDAVDNGIGATGAAAQPSAEDLVLIFDGLLHLQASQACGTTDPLQQRPFHEVTRLRVEAAEMRMPIKTGAFAATL